MFVVIACICFAFFGGQVSGNASMSYIPLLKKVNVTKDRRNRGNSSKFDFAHTGRPESHTYDKDVYFLKYALVLEKFSNFKSLTVFS